MIPFCKTKKIYKNILKIMKDTIFDLEDTMALAGIVRRLDELGRIVIPKEMRRTLHLNEGDEMEITMQTDTVTLRKYSGFESIVATLKAVAGLLSKETQADVLVVTQDSVVAAEGKNKKRYIGAELTETFSDAVRARRAVVFHGDELSNLFRDKQCDCVYAVYEPVTVRGDLVGGAMLMLDSLPSDISRAYLHFCVGLIEASLS